MAVAGRSARRRLGGCAVTVGQPNSVLLCMPTVVSCRWLHYAISMISCQSCCGGFGGEEGSIRAPAIPPNCPSLPGVPAGGVLPPVPGAIGGCAFCVSNSFCHCHCPLLPLGQQSAAITAEGEHALGRLPHLQLTALEEVSLMGGDPRSVSEHSSPLLLDPRSQLERPSPRAQLPPPSPGGRSVGSFTYRLRE